MIASPLLLTMSTSYCHSLHLPITLCCYCIIELYWLVSCLVLLHCIVYLHIPSVYSEYRFHSSPHSHVCWCVCISLAGRTIYFVLLLCIIRCDIAYWHCVLLLAFCHWHWHFLLLICLLPQLLRAVAPALTLTTSFKLRQVWCFASYCWLIVGWFWCSLCCSLILFSVSKLFFPFIILFGTST